MIKKPVDLILHNGLIWTGDDSKPQAEALAVAAGCIIAVGKTSEIFQSYTANKYVALHGQRLIPGLHDSHLHLIETGIREKWANLEECRNVSEMIDCYINHYKKMPPQDESEWLIGRGFHGYEPTCADLDQLEKIFPRRPVIAVRVCGHSVVCNSYLLNIAGIKKGFHRRFGYPSCIKIRKRAHR